MQSILLVDDSNSLTSLFRQRIQETLPVQVVSASSFAQARHILEGSKESFFLAILDLHLPDSPDGEVVDYVLDQGIPSIVLTATYKEEIRQTILKKGVLDYFIKDHARVVEVVLHAVERIRKNGSTGVVVADDSASVRKMLVSLLERYGFHPLQAENGQQVLEVMEQHPIDLIISDYHMPVMNGIVLIKKLRAKYTFNEKVIIGYSAITDRSLAVEFIKAGANDFLFKPFQPEELLSRVHHNVELVERYRDLQQMVDRHQSVLTHALDAIITIDHAGIVMDYNPAAEVLFGYPAKEVIGKRLEKFIIPVQMRKAYLQALEKYSQMGDSPVQLMRRLEMSGLRADGKKVDLQISLTTIQQDGRTCFTAFLQDITDKKQLLKSLEETLAVAESANRAKSDFIANISHEIRTPMNAVIGFTELARKVEAPPKLKDYLDKIENGSRSLMGIINDILDFSKMEAGRIKIEPVKFDLHQLTDRLANLFSKQVADKGLELVFLVPYNFDAVLYGDVGRLEQILINLIRNAVKFTDHGGISVTVTVERASPQQVALVFAVQDTGMGIDSSMLPTLFQPFVQADESSSRKHGGTGLGLSISKRLVQLLGGEIHAESQPGVGSVFSFKVMVEYHSDNRRQTVGLPAELTGRKALVVDDHSLVREQLLTMLRSLHMEPVVAASARDGIALLERQQAGKDPFALALFDWQMPHKDGITAIVEARASLDAKRLPQPLLIPMVPFGVEEAGRLAAKIGCEYTLDKPIVRSRLIQIIGGAMGVDTLNVEKRQERPLRLTSETGPRVAGARVLFVSENEVNRMVAVNLMGRVGVVVETAGDYKQSRLLLERFPFDLAFVDRHIQEWKDGSGIAWLRSQPHLAMLPVIAMGSVGNPEEKQNIIQSGMNFFLYYPLRQERVYGILYKWIPQQPEGAPLSALAGEDFSFLQGVDYPGALVRLQENRSLYRKLLERFCHQFANVTDSIGNALQKGLYTEALSSVHVLGCLADRIGASRLVRASLQLEEALLAGNSLTVDTQWTVFSDELTKFFNLLGANRSILSSAKPVTRVEDVVLDGEWLSHQLSDLAAHLERHSLAANYALAELTRQLHDTPFFMELRELARQLEGYHFSESLVVARRLAERAGIHWPAPQVFEHTWQRERILIVDDQSSNINLLVDVLTDWHCMVATHGRDALAIACVNPAPEIILLDVMMPEMNGFDVCRYLKADPATSQIPVIFITARKEAVDESLGFQLGGVDFITKPFHPDSVRRRVIHHLELKRHRQQLEELVAQRTAELLAAKAEADHRKDAAEAGNRAKSRFLATMSHEIRTPMNAILGMAEALSETDLTPEQQGFVTVFQRAGERLLGLINDVLDLSKVESGRLALEAQPFQLDELLASTTRLVKSRAEEKGIQLIVEGAPGLPSTVEGDFNRLHQVILNLLDNAIKFTHEGSVTLRLLPLANNLGVRFEVEDTGIGVPEDKRQDIFHGFVQADASITRRYGGSGLGLAICHRLVHRMGGDIGVISTLGKGSLFYVQLPLKGLADGPQTTLAPQVAPAVLDLQQTEQGAEILLTEDAVDNVLLIQVFLKKTPHKLTIASNGEEALALFKQRSFDLVLMDLQMPVMDGFTATAIMRRHEEENRLPATPIVALTAHAFAEDHQRALDAGCNDFLTKPLAKQKLLETIHRLIRGK
ncbi:MAG: response regulator [Magnetococcales bacterium]|nr:response regulator [Magnetococcales bacterium]